MSGEKRSPVREAVRGLTAVVKDELLQAAELGAGGDVETAAVQFPDFVMFNIQAFGVVIVEHGQAVRPCEQDRKNGTRRRVRTVKPAVCVTSCSLEFPQQLCP